MLDWTTSGYRQHSILQLDFYQETLRTGFWVEHQIVEHFLSFPEHPHLSQFDLFRERCELSTAVLSKNHLK